jgi:aminopeptidase
MPGRQIIISPGGPAFMLSEKQLENYADVLLWGLKKARTQRYRKSDIIMVRFDLAALRLAEILQAKILGLGMNPLLRLNGTPAMDLNFYGMANRQQLVFQAPGSRELLSRLNGSIFLSAPESLTHLRSTDPKKIAMAAIAYKPLRDILNKRDERGAFGWTLCTLPTAELARHARLSLADYTRQVIRACYLNRPDPPREWETIFNDARSLKQWLNSLQVKHYAVQSASFDLVITPGERRKWIGISGHNIPSFEIFLSPDWRGTEGTYYANLPSFRSGNYISGVRLEFKKGSAVTVRAEEGEAFARKQLSMDSGACRVGEFSLTDKRFSRINTFMANTLFDENFGGTYGNCHLAVGSSYSDTYDGNQAALTRERKERLGFNDSALHWDLVNTERKTVTAHLTSGKKVVIYENGMFCC